MSRHCLRTTRVFLSLRERFLKTLAWGRRSRDGCPRGALEERVAREKKPLAERGEYARRRRGLTFIELVIAMSLMVVLVGTLETLAEAVHEAFEYNESHGLELQHARVVLDRISRTASGAFANEQFPGFIVLSTQVGSYSYPDTLVVWRPASGTPVNPTGLPQFNELVVYCPSTSNPIQLLEITVLNDTRTVPLPSATATWATEIAAIKSSTVNTNVMLTDLMRSATPSGSGAKRGAVRFTTRSIPSDAQWAQYKASTLTWKQLTWCQGLYGSTTGLRQVWLRTEIQMVPAPNIMAEEMVATVATPFFGSAALYYEMHR